MAIDTTISLVALLSGLFGAILTAILSYFVSIKIKENKDNKRKKQRAFVHFIQLTDMVARDFILKEIVNNMSKDFETNEDEFSFEHIVAVYLSDQLKKIDDETKEELMFLINPLIDQAVKSIDRVYLSPEQLAELPQDTIFCYNRYVAKAMQIKSTLTSFESTLQLKKFSSFGTDFLYAALLTYKDFAKSAGILRASFVKFGAISDEYALAALRRSYEVQMEDINSSMAHTTKFKKAKKLLEESLLNSDQIYTTTTEDE